MFRFFTSTRPSERARQFTKFGFGLMRVFAVLVSASMVLGIALPSLARSTQASPSSEAGNTFVDANFENTNSPPDIDDFKAIEGPDGLWHFEGHVTDDESTEGLTVRFGGLDGLLDGMEATVNENGTFRLTVPLPAGTRGTATAQITDCDDEESEVEYALVRSTHGDPGGVL